MSDIVTRSAWKARAPKETWESMPSGVKGVKVHYTGDHVDPGLLKNHALCTQKVRQIQNFHMDGNGWIDIGYSVVACPHKKIYIGRGPKHLPAANGAGLNSGHYAVLALVGKSGLVTPSDDQLICILDAIEYLRKNGPCGNEIKGHRDGYATECPGGPLYAWVKAGAKRPGGTPSAPKPKPPTYRPVPAPPWPNKYLAYPPMHHSESCERWQVQMNKRGFKLVVDGYYGPKSEDACRTLQSHQGAKVDGVVGPVTWRITWESPVK